MSSQSPYDKAGIISQIAFDYVRPLLRKGALFPLQEIDLPPMANRDDVEMNINKVETAWNEELERAKKADTKPEFVRALILAFKYDFLAGSFYSLIEELIILAQVNTHFQSICLIFLQVWIY
jgi:hypothetical protein